VLIAEDHEDSRDALKTLLDAFGYRVLEDHHERWAGGGYPHGLRGEQIPLGARILAVADSLDAMSSARPYRAALPREVIVSEFKRHAGTQWDPAVVAAVLDLIEGGTIRLSATGETLQVYDGLGTVVQGH
jgi:HD-GYP domain-containing protein (c-di-GMP phosphodiesterase class II)